MYAFIEGEVCEKSNGFLVLMAAGVGWQLLCSNTTLQAAPALGQKMRCHTFLSVREDAMELYGFATREEKAMFLQLTSVTGIGPKTALGVLGSMPLRDLSLAILLGDVNALSRAPGIGKKTAQRIALELKDKITQADVSSVSAGPSDVPGAVPSASGAVVEAIEALTALGYSSTEARNALAQIPDPPEKPEELIRLALRAMAGM